MKISRYVRITPGSVVLDGTPLEIQGHGMELLSGLYRSRKTDYPKFFKMDVLSKLGFMATELLVAGDPDRFTPREDRAVLLVSRSGPLSDDLNYQKTIGEDNYFPSPALFVYTLANIVTGEIAIRNKYEGDTTAFETEGFSPGMIFSLVRDAFEDRTTTSAVCGWVEAPSPDDFDCLLMLVAREDGRGLDFTEQEIQRLYR